MVSQLESSVEEAAATRAWLDASPLLPSVLAPEDSELLLQSLLKQHESFRGYVIHAQTVLVPQDLIDKVQLSLEDMMADQAKRDLESKKYDKILSGGSGTGVDK